MFKVPKGDYFPWVSVGVPELETQYIFSLLFRYTPIHWLSVLKLSRPLPPKESDLPGLSRPTKDGSGQPHSMLFCSHSCAPQGLCEALRHSIIKASNWLSATSRLPSSSWVSSVLTLHQPSQHRHLHSSANDIYICVYCGYFYTVKAKIMTVVLAFKIKGKE